MIVIDQLAQFMSITGAETIFDPLRLHLQAADLLEQLRFLGLPLLLVLRLLAPREHLAGAVEQLSFLLAHLNRVDGVFGCYLLDRLAAADRLYGDPGLELGAVHAALTHRWDPRIRGGTPP